MISEKHLFYFSLFGFVCGFCAAFLGMMTNTLSSIIIGIIGMIGNWINMFRFRDFI